MRKGFTLVELLVVILILAILAGALVVLLGALIVDGKIKDTAARINILAAACEVYHAEFQTYPPDSTYAGSANLHWYLGREFPELVRRNPDWYRPHKPYVEFTSNWAPGPMPSPIIDSWNSPLDYKVGPAGVTIRSAGPDGAFGTSDDMRNPARD